MLSFEEKSYIQKNAYIPEHLYLYVNSISGLEPFYYHPFLSYESDDYVLFVGYPLDGNLSPERIREVLYKLKSRRRARISVILPCILEGIKPSSQDIYYLLDLKDVRISGKTKNMVKRARREIITEEGREITYEHKILIEKFIEERKLDEKMSFILRNLHKYVEASPSVIVITARKKNGTPVAFNVLDLFSCLYAFFMFNVRTKKEYVPGTSDLLFCEMVKIAENQKRKYINLGLGINEGVKFFKEKWGGKPFMTYYLCELKTKKTIFDLFFERFFF